MKYVFFLFLFFITFEMTASAKDLEAKIILSQSETAGFLALSATEGWSTEKMQIRFFDTQNLDLFTDGVVIRVRSRETKVPELTLKLRPFEGKELSNSWFGKLPNDFELKCELDAHIAKRTESCSLSRVLSSIELRQFEETQDISQLLQPIELEFLALKTSRFPGVKLKTSFQAQRWRLPQKMTAELWTLADKSDVVEISKKVDSEKADLAFEDLHKWAKEHDLKVDPHPTNKTEKALRLR